MSRRKFKKGWPWKVRLAAWLLKDWPYHVAANPPKGVPKKKNAPLLGEERGKG